MESVIRLIGAVCCDQNDSWKVGKEVTEKAPSGKDYKSEQMSEPTISGWIEVMQAIQEAFDKKKKAAKI